MKLLIYTLKRSIKVSLSYLVASLTFVITACAFIPAASTTAPGTPGVGTSDTRGIVALNGYQITLFAPGTSSYFQPASVVVGNNHIFIAYQNDAANDGSSTKSSTVVEYSMDGKVTQTFSTPGQCSGMDIDPKSQLLWVISNKSANPLLTTIDTVRGTMTYYTFPKTPHSGGYDDVYFINGSAFISASNPLANNNGINVFPVVDKVVLNNGKVALTSAMHGNAVATDITSGNNTQGNLNVQDPEGLSADPKGDLVLLNQSASEIILINKPGTAQQKVSRLSAGSQISQIAWSTATHGRFLLVDSARNATYWIQATFTPGTAYTQTAGNSGVAGVLGKIDMGTGIISPMAIGFGSPADLFFVPDTQITK